MRIRFLLATALAVFATSSFAALDKPECIAGAKPGGGFDLTCKLAQTADAGGQDLAGADAHHLHAGRHRRGGDERGRRPAPG